MTNEERFWESAIAEAVREDTPPDVAPRVLAELADDAQSNEPRAEPRPRGRVIRAVARYGLEIGTAAAVVLAIAWATGLVRFGGDAGDTGIPGCGDASDGLVYAASPNAELLERDEYIELKRGWLLVTTGAPEIRRGDSKLTEVDGRVLLHAGKAPTREQVTAVREWLNANELEEEMITNPKRWIAGAALAALVLSGSANLDGERIDAQDEDKSTEVVWHKVRSVMDIDNLPEGAEYVNADGTNAALLDFLAEVETLKGISLREGWELRAEHLESLAVLQRLEWLELRETKWVTSGDFAGRVSGRPLLELKSLKHIGFDLIPANYNLSQSRQAFDFGSTTLPTLGELSKRGVEIELGIWDPDGQESLRHVLEALPTLRGAEIQSASVGDMKMLSQHEGLQSLRLVQYGEGEIGLAYLARTNSLNELHLSADGIGVSELHQISRMGLRSLAIDAELDGRPGECFALLAGMENLRELELTDLELSDEDERAIANLSGMSKLNRLRIGEDVLDHNWERALMLAHHVPTRRLEIAYDGLALAAMSHIPEWMQEGKAGLNLEEIRFDVHSAGFDRDDYGNEYFAPFKTYPNLKRIEVRRGGFDEPSQEDEFVRWLKEGLPDVEVVVVP